MEVVKIDDIIHSLKIYFVMYRSSVLFHFSFHVWFQLFQLGVDWFSYRYFCSLQLQRIQQNPAMVWWTLSSTLFSVTILASLRRRSASTFWGWWLYSQQVHYCCK